MNQFGIVGWNVEADEKLLRPGIPHRVSAFSALSKNAVPVPGAGVIEAPRSGLVNDGEAALRFVGASQTDDCAKQPDSLKRFSG